MKPRGVNSLLNKQTDNSTGGKPAAASSGINWNAALGAGTPGSDKHDQNKKAREKNNKGPNAKQSTGGSKNAAAVPRRTAPGA